MKKTFFMVLLSIVMVGSIFSQGNKDSQVSNDKTTLTILDAFVPGEGMTKAFEAVLEDFKQANPDVAIDEETISNSDLSVKVQTLAAADELPDVFGLKGQMAESFVKNGKILPLGDFLKEDSDWQSQFKDGVFSNFTFGNEIYGIPYQITNTCIYYNDSLLKQAGIDTFPTTWEGLITAVKALKAAGITPIVLGNKEKWNAESVIMSTLGNRVSGNDWYQDIRAQEGAKFTDPEFVDALKALRDLVAAGAFNTDINSIDGAQQRQVFMNGKAAMTVDGTWAIAEFDLNCPKEVLDNIKIAAIPSVKGGKGDPNAISGGSGWALAVNAKIDPAKIPAVKAFLKTIVNTKFSSILAGSGSPTAFIPGDFTLDPSQVVAIRFNEFQKGRSYVPVYDHQLSSGVMQVMQTGLQNLLIGQVTPEQLAEDIQIEYTR